MSNAITVAHKFEQFVTLHGDDPFISRTISKMFSTRLGQLQKELKAVQTSLAHYERCYGKASDEFIAQYQAGTAGDDMDFIEWSALVRMRARLLAERSILQA